MTDPTPPSRPSSLSSDPTFATSVPTTGGKISTTPPKKRRRWRLKLAVVILVLVIAGGLWSWAALTFSYSSGERQGYVQSLARRGWLCKTWEGELAVAPLPGTAVGATPEIFTFTIRDDSVATALQRTSGLIALQYGEHRGVPTSCFGETESYVTSFRVVP